MTDSLTPISMRLNETVIASLQKEARKQSFEQEKDISYVELVRDAVASYVQSLTKDTVDPIMVDAGRTLVSIAASDEDMDATMGTGGHHLSKLKIKDVLRFLGINFDDPVGKAISTDVQEAIEQQSLARVLLHVHKLRPGEVAKYGRDVSSIAQVVPRRGGVPDKLVEGDEVIVPTFEIACHPTFKLDDLLSGMSNMVGEANITATDALIREEEANVLSSLKAAAEWKVPSQVIEVEDKITIGHLEEAFAKIAQHGEFPLHMICSYTTLSNIRLAALGLTGDWKFELNPHYDVSSKIPKIGGHFRTATIHISNRMNDGEVLFSGDPKLLGRMPIKHNPLCLASNDTTKLRGGYVIWESIGIVILRDHFVSYIIPKRKVHKKNVGKTS